MNDSLAHEAREQIRGVIGALFVAGVTFHYTMETWWLGWTLPLSHLIVYASVGLVFVLFVDRSIGFRTEQKDEQDRRLSIRRAAIDLSEIVFQSFIASYAMLFLIGLVDASTSLTLMARLGLIEVVPLALGAALANELLGKEPEQIDPEEQFPTNVGVFALGTLFVSLPIAPTQEMELISAHMQWYRHLLLIPVTLLVIYLFLYELEFKGQDTRTERNWTFHVGTTFLVYTVGAVISFLLLAAYGHFSEPTLELIVQETTVLAFPASLGAAGAEVVI